MGLQPPGTGVGHLDADASQQRPDVVGPPQVDAPARRGVAQHSGVTGGPLDVGLGRRRRPGPDDGGDDPLGLDAVDGQAVGGQLHAQQLGRRLRPGRRGRPSGQGVGQGDAGGRRRRSPAPPIAEGAWASPTTRRPPTPAAGGRRRRADPRAPRGRGPARTGRAGGGAGWCRGRGRARRPTPWPGRRATRRTAAGGPPRRPSTWRDGRPPGRARRAWPATTTPSAAGDPRRAVATLRRRGRRTAPFARAGRPRVRRAGRPPRRRGRHAVRQRHPGGDRAARSWPSLRRRRRRRGAGDRHGPASWQRSHDTVREETYPALGRPAGARRPENAGEVACARSWSSPTARSAVTSSPR